MVISDKSPRDLKLKKYLNVSTLGHAAYATASSGSQLAILSTVPDP